MRVLLACALLAIALPVSATERFRLGARLGEGDLVTEWIELEPGSARNQTTMLGGMPFWDTTVQFSGEPLVAKHILGKLYSPFAPEAAPGVFEGTRVKDGVRLVSAPLGHEKTDTTETWQEGAVFLPRSLLGYELVMRQMRARRLQSMEFTWFDPQFRTMTGSVKYVGDHRVRIQFDQEQGMFDEFVIDDEGHITGGDLGVGGTVYRGEWLPKERREQ